MSGSLPFKYFNLSVFNSSLISIKKWLELISVWQHYFCPEQQSGECNMMHWCYWRCGKHAEFIVWAVIVDDRYDSCISEWQTLRQLSPASVLSFVVVVVEVWGGLQLKTLLKLTAPISFSFFFSPAEAAQKKKKKTSLCVLLAQHQMSDRQS